MKEKKQEMSSLPIVKHLSEDTNWLYDCWPVNEKRLNKIDYYWLILFIIDEIGVAEKFVGGVKAAVA